MKICRVCDGRFERVSVSWKLKIRGYGQCHELDLIRVIISRGLIPENVQYPSSSLNANKIKLIRHIRLFYYVNWEELTLEQSQRQGKYFTRRYLMLLLGMWNCVEKGASSRKFFVNLIRSISHSRMRNERNYRTRDTSNRWSSKDERKMLDRIIGIFLSARYDYAEQGFQCWRDIVEMAIEEGNYNRPCSTWKFSHRSWQDERLRW